MSHFALDVAADYIKRGLIPFRKAQRILAAHGYELRQNPCSLSFHDRSGRNVHQITTFDRAAVH